MTQTNAERQRAYRERHRGEPRGNTAMQVQLAVLQLGAWPSWKSNWRVGQWPAL